MFQKVEQRNTVRIEQSEHHWIAFSSFFHGKKLEKQLLVSSKEKLPASKIKKHRTR